MSPLETMQRVEALLTHVWMVRTFIKHSEEAEEDDELKAIQQVLYDYMLALGTASKNQDTDAYLHQAHKKLTRLTRATEQFAEIQPEVSSHMNYRMAVRSLQAAVGEICEILGESR